VQQNLSGARAEAEEHRDRENRRNNVIVYNVTESKELKLTTETDMMQHSACSSLTACKYGYQRRT